MLQNRPMSRRRTGNPKRRMSGKPKTKADRNALDILASKVGYTGSPAHKRNPGDFGLIPPSQPREGKTLCDGAGIVKRLRAKALLKEGVRRGMVSKQKRQAWPQYIWAVHEGRIPLEAILENAEIGTYHGYPLQQDDPFYDEILRRWKSE